MFVIDPEERITAEGVIFIASLDIEPSVDKQTKRGSSCSKKTKEWCHWYKEDAIWVKRAKPFGQARRFKQEKARIWDDLRQKCSQTKVIEWKFEQHYEQDDQNVENIEKSKNWGEIALQQEDEGWP